MFAGTAAQLPNASRADQANNRAPLGGSRRRAPARQRAFRTDKEARRAGSNGCPAKIQNEGFLAVIHRHDRS